MESDAHEMMLELERAEAAPYVNYQPTPWWYGPYFGLYFVGLVLGMDWVENTWVRIAMLVVLLGSLFLVLRHVRRRNGVLILPMPGRGNPPPEIAARFRLYWWSLVPVGGGLFACLLLLPPLVTAAIAFVAVTVGFVLFDRSYARAAAAVRERLS